MPATDTMPTPPTPAVLDRVLRLREVESVSGLKRSKLYELIRAGLFPKQVSLGTRDVGWLQSEVQAWITNLRTARDRAA